MTERIRVSTTGNRHKLPSVLAIIAVRNEALYIRTCLEHLRAEGVRCIVIDNESTDETVAICQEFYPDHVVSIEHQPFPGFYDWQAILARKDELRASADADWVIHHDADEIMHSNRPDETLVEGIARVAAAGYNAINFDEFVFIHDNDHIDYAGRDYYQEMRHYYYFNPQGKHPRLVRASSKEVQGNIAWSGGHMPSGTNLRIFPERFVLRHYICLSKEQAVRKYSQRTYSKVELRRGWHRNRVGVNTARYSSPGPQQLQQLQDDLRALDYSRPRAEHYWHWGDPRWWLRRRMLRMSALLRRLRARVRR